MEKIKNIYKQGELLSKVNNPEDLRKTKNQRITIISQRAKAVYN